jgi:hypothetical protein
VQDGKVGYVDAVHVAGDRGRLDAGLVVVANVKHPVALMLVGTQQLVLQCHMVGQQAIVDNATVLTKISMALQKKRRLGEFMSQSTHPPSPQNRSEGASMELKDLAYRFYESPVEKLFQDIRTLAVPRIKVPSDVESQLDKYLEEATKCCTSEWTCTQPVLFRARKSDYGQFEKFATKDMGPPPAAIVSAGRAQLAGDAMLYLADSCQTAITEVKPDVGEYVTVGNFRINPGKPVKILDLTQFKAVYSVKVSQLQNLINLSRYVFSAPVHPAQPRKYYAQAYFVQKIRDLGYDGIGYESAIHDKGRCFAFFDASLFKCTRTQLHQVKMVKILAEHVAFSRQDKRYIADQKTKRKPKKEHHLPHRQP